MLRLKLEALSKKLGLSVEDVKNMIVYEHLLKNILPKCSLKNVNVNLNKKDINTINKISKYLKISNDAVICTMLTNYIEKNEKEI